MKWLNINMTDFDMTACAIKIEIVVIWLTVLQPPLTPALLMINPLSTVLNTVTYFVFLLVSFHPLT